MWLVLVVFFRGLSTPPDHAVHLLPLSHSLGRHTQPPGSQTIAKSPLKHLHRPLPKQTITPQPQMHRHEKPPVSWTSISMSKKREAVQKDEAGVAFVYRVRSEVGDGGDGDGHVAASGLGVRAQLVGAVDEGLGPVEFDAGDEDLNVGGEGEGVALGA